MAATGHQASSWSGDTSIEWVVLSSRITPMTVKASGDHIRHRPSGWYSRVMTAVSAEAMAIRITNSGHASVHGQPVICWTTKTRPMPTSHTPATMSPSRSGAERVALIIGPSIFADAPQRRCRSAPLAGKAGPLAGACGSRSSCVVTVVTRAR